MASLKLSVISVNDLPDAVAKILEFCSGEQVLVFYGQMGAGKTTLITELCKQLSVTDSVTSPTYSIVNEYHGAVKCYHFDLFRLESESELIDIGFEDYLDGQAMLFIEWPELALPFLDNYVELRIEVVSETQRDIVVQSKVI